jgi:hypothetical protein
MKARLVIGWLVCFVLLAAGPTRCVFADDDAEAIERYRARRAEAEARMREMANEVRKAKEAQIKELEGRLAEVRKWTNVQFELGERGIIDKPKTMSTLMKRWQTQRKREIDQFLQFPEKSGLAIESGRALNALMDQVGASAFQNSEARKIKPDSVFPLSDCGEYTKVDPALVEEITWQENVAGVKLVGQGSRGPLDMDWPAVLHEERWREHRERCDNVAKRALQELGTSSGLSAKTDAELRAAIAALNADFADYRGEWIRTQHPSADGGLELQRIFEGTRHLKKLSLGAYQLVELGSYQTIQRERFQGGTIEDYMAYLQRHNLRFAPAGPAHRSAYRRIFAMIVRYYLDERMAMNMERQLEKELSRLKRIDKEAIDVALGRTMSASDQAAIRILELKNIYELLR